MTYRGEVKGGVVVLEPGAQLAEGTVVHVQPVDQASASDAEQLGPVFRMGQLAVETGIADLATNADHYLYGHPKVSDAG